MPEPRLTTAWSQDSAQFDAEVDGLLSVIELSRGDADRADENTRPPSLGGSISIAICNTVPTRERVARAVRERYPGLVMVVMPPDATNPYAEAEKVVNQSGVMPDAIFVAGLELHDAALGRLRAEALNLSRELWRRRWPVAAVFFIAKPELPVLMKDAPDIWSWRSHLFDFAEPSLEAASVFQLPSDSLGSDIDAAAEPMLRARLQELRARMDRPVDLAEQADVSRRVAWASESGRIEYRLGDYRAAAREFETAALWAESAQAWDTVILARVWASDAHRLSGDLVASERIARAATELALPREGVGSASLPAVLSNLALIQMDQGDLLEARASMKKAITIAKLHLGAEHPNLATLLSNLATIQQAQDELGAARGNMEQAIAIDSKHLTPEHPTFAIRYSNLAGIQQDQGDLPGARASMERAIAIQLKHFAPDHPNIAISYNNLAHIAVAQGDIPEAVALWRKAHAIRLKALGPDHPYTKRVAAMLRKYDPPGP